MAFINWSDRYSVGNQEIDDQHKKLVAIVNQLHDGMRSGQGKNVLAKVFSDLTTYTMTHFAAEERLMTAKNYPGYLEHKLAHDDLTKQVKKLNEDFLSGKVLLTLDLMDFLQDWLTSHIMQSDRNLGAFLTARTVSSGAAGQAGAATQAGLLEWSDRYRVGVRRIDHQHQKLVDMVNELHSGMRAGQSREMLGGILDNLITYTVTHFAMEEGLMAEHHYSEYQKHKKEHDDLTRQVQVLQADFKSGKVLLSLKVMNFLQDWLISHIQDVDKKLGRFLNGKGVL